MIDDPARPVPTLDYQRHQNVKTPTALRRYRVLLVIVALLACLLALIPMGYPQPLIMAVIVGPFVLYFRWLARMKRASRWTDVQEESVWRQYQQRKHEMLRVARQIYKNAPIGTWSATGVNTIAKSTVSLVFNADGIGHYHFSSSGGESLEIETAFQFKPLGLAALHDRSTEDIDGSTKTDHRSPVVGALLVRFRSPEIEGWHTLYYGFYVERSDKDNFKLYIWFEGKNPFAIESKHFWPFSADLTREG